MEKPRIAGSIRHIVTDLGFLANLPGIWVGDGFNVVSLPDFAAGADTFQVKARPTKETLTFSTFGGKIPNRGDIQPDIFFLGIHYLQLVSDGLTNEGMHFEPGLWLNMPPTVPPAGPVDPAVDPDTQRLLVRQGTVPHGDAFVALSTNLIHLNTAPTAANPNPNDPRFQNQTTVPIPNPGVPAPPLTQFTNAQAALPSTPPLGAGVVNDPDLVLTGQLAAIKALGNTIVDNRVIIISTDVPVPAPTAPDPLAHLAGGVVNVPFVVQNANAAQMDAIFWIETFRPDGGDPGGDDDFMVLQYSQRVILSFNSISWPHVSVATLFKQ
jgi:hypothetical protein